MGFQTSQGEQQFRRAFAWPQRLWHALRQAWAALFTWRLAAILLVYGVLTLLVVQIPFSYRFTVGQERGVGSDLPFLQGFYPFEALGGGDPNLASERYRWSKAEEARIEIPGVGQRGVVVEFEIASHRAQHFPEDGPTILNLVTGDGTVTSFPLRTAGAHYQIYLPPSALPDGRLDLRPLTAVWNIPGDSRTELGVALARSVAVHSTTSGLVLPDLWLLGGWLLALVLLWMSLGMIGFAAPSAFRLLLVPAIVVPLSGLIDLPRLGFTGAWSVQFALLSLAMAAAAVVLVPPTLRWFAVVPDPAMLRWLLLLVVLTFGLKYGARLYPESMPGDIQLHVNRFGGTLRGQIYLVAQHRGLPFPFPPALYLLLAPFTAFGINIRGLFQVMAGIFEASSVVLIYLLTVRGGLSQRLGLGAAAIYAGTAANFMTTWFSFQTQTAAQGFQVALMLLLIACWPRFADRRIWWTLIVLMALVFLGHIGQFLNTVLLGLLLLLWLWWRYRAPAERRATAWLFGASLVAALIVGLFYYSAFLGLILDQVAGVASGGLNEVTGKQPIPRATTLQVLWEGGLITHYGFFPVLFAIPGLWWIATRRRGSLLPVLIGLTFVVSAAQAVLPLITLSSISTRWLSFSAWGVAVAGAAGWRLLWRREWAARLVVVVMAAYVLWITLGIFVDAMFLRKPPIEPF